MARGVVRPSVCACLFSTKSELALSDLPYCCPLDTFFLAFRAFAFQHEPGIPIPAASIATLLQCSADRPTE
jgi:hypothetical protein